MGFKDVFNQAKQKVKETIDKGNHELKKYSASIKMSIYSKPVLGSFLSKQVFREEKRILIPVDCFNEEDIFIHAIFKLEDDDAVYVITEIEKEEEIKELIVNEKPFRYSCYILKFHLLSDIFTEETISIPYQELTEKQHTLLNQIHKEIEEYLFIAKEKKKAIDKLWQYFTECISYQLKDHYVIDAFVKIADDYVTDFSSILLKIFA